MFLWLLTLYLKVEPMAPFCFYTIIWTLPANLAFCFPFLPPIFVFPAKQAVNDAGARRRSMESGQMAPWSRTCGASSLRLNGSPCRPKGRLVLWPVVCPMPADESAVKGRQRGGRLPVAERVSPLTALQAAGIHARRAIGMEVRGGRGRRNNKC